MLDAFWGGGWRTDERFRVVYLGPEASRFRLDSPARTERQRRIARGADPVLIHIGRFQPEKNHRALIPIAREVVQRWSGATFVLVGEGPMRGEIESAVDAAGLSPTFRFLGDRDDVPELLSNADALLLPSLREGLPGVVLEALAAGVPVVGSRIAPVEEIARVSGGVVCADPSSPSEFADAIAAAIELAPVRLNDRLTAEAATRGLADLYARVPDSRPKKNVPDHPGVAA